MKNHHLTVTIEGFAPIIILGKCKTLLGRSPAQFNEVAMLVKNVSEVARVYPCRTKMTVVDKYKYK